MSKPTDTQEFIKLSNEIHNFKYDYSNVNYINLSRKIVIICPIHGEFRQKPSNHLRGQGCNSCGEISRINKRILTTEQFIEKANKIHNGIYNYSGVLYERHSKKVSIICNKHGEFNQLANSHLSGIGCPKCGKIDRSLWNRSNFISYCLERNIHPVVYIVRLFNLETNEEFIKIGRTSRTIHARMYKIPYEYEILKTIEGSPAFIYDKEKELHRLYSKYKYSPNTDFDGRYECFSMDILCKI